MEQEPKSSPHALAKFWLIVAGVSAAFFALAWLGAGVWHRYAKDTLLWDASKTEAVTYSAFAIPFALMLWFGVRFVTKLPDSASEAKRKDAVQSLIVQPLAWSLLLVAYTLSEMRGTWHVAREIYFILVFAATSLMCISFLAQYKLNKAKMHLLPALIWASLFCVFLHRCVWSDPSKGIFG